MKRQEMEKAIVEEVVKSALAKGFSLKVDNGESVSDEYKSIDILNDMFATDEEHLLFILNGKAFGVVFFVYGNDGYDVIADYDTKLEEVLSSALKLAESYQ